MATEAEQDEIELPSDGYSEQDEADQPLLPQRRDERLFRNVYQKGENLTQILGDWINFKLLTRKHEIIIATIFFLTLLGGIILATVSHIRLKLLFQDTLISIETDTGAHRHLNDQKQTPPDPSDPSPTCEPERTHCTTDGAGCCQVITSTDATATATATCFSGCVGWHCRGSNDCFGALTCNPYAMTCESCEGCYGWTVTTITAGR